MWSEVEKLQGEVEDAESCFISHMLQLAARSTVQGLGPKDRADFKIIIFNSVPTDQQQLFYCKRHED